MYPRPKAVFFDFDGVILESAQIKTEAFSELFADYPHLQAQILEYHLANMGVSRFKKFEWIYANLLHKEFGPAESTQLGEAFARIVFKKVLAAPYVAGAVQLLETLRSSECLNFVASGTPEAELHEIVKLRGIDHFFHEVCGSPRSKADIVNELLAQYNLQPGECIFIGDANTDHEAALSTGLKFIARNTAEMASYWSACQNIWLVSTMQEVADYYRSA